MDNLVLLKTEGFYDIVPALILVIVPIILLRYILS